MNPPAGANALNIKETRELPGRSTIDFYDRNAATYAESTRARSLEEEIQRFAVHVARGARVLDIGCGAGRDLVALREAGLAPTGLELSANLAQIAREYSECPVVVGDMRNPPFADSSFAGLWAAASLLHLDRDEMLPALSQLRRLLEPEGVFFASMKMGVGSDRGPDGRLFTYFMPEDWSELLNAAGFTSIYIGQELVPGRRTGMPASAWLQSLSLAV